MDSHRVQSASDEDHEGEARPPSSRTQSVPPFDPTVAPSVKLQLQPTPSRPREAARPILASDCLREDLAPTEPYPRATRLAIAAAGLLTIAAATLVLRTSVVPGVVLLLSGGIALNAARSREYATRGRLALLSVIGCLAFPSLVTLAAGLLASALFVRASYRAHRGVRVALAVGIGAFVLSAGLAFGATTAAHVGAGLMLAVAATSLLGFMGEQTTAGCAVWGGFAVASSAAVVLLSKPLSLASIGLALGSLGVSTAVTVAGYVVAASRIGPRASSPRSNDA